MGKKMVFPRKLALGKDMGRRLPGGRVAGRAVGDLHQALRKLKLDVGKSDLARKEMGASTVAALKDLQKKLGLEADGKLSAQAVARINAEVDHRFVSESRTRTRRLHELLGRAGYKVGAGEAGARRFGPETEAALKGFQGESGLAPDGLASEELFRRLREAAVKKRFSARTQVGKLHHDLARALHVAKLGGPRIGPAELKNKTIGPTTREALRAIQKKYGLPEDGELGASTYDQILSLVASVPGARKLMKAPPASRLKALGGSARLNMTGGRVGAVQEALAALGHPIEAAEFEAKRFGGSTRKAVLAFEQSRGLPPTGQVTKATLKRLNQAIFEANPSASPSAGSFRLRGSVRDRLWEGNGKGRVEVWEKPVSGPEVKLAERSCTAEGFFDVPYDPPASFAGKSFRVLVKFYDAGGRPIGQRVVFNPTRIAWANFTEGERAYQGESEFEARMKAVHRVSGGVRAEELTETDSRPQISEAAESAGLSPDEVMRLVLCHRVAAELGHPALEPAACYAYLVQNVPATLPPDLLDAADGWREIGALVGAAAAGLVFAEPETLSLAFEGAVARNLVPVAVGLRKAEVLAALAGLRKSYALEKPIFVGDQSLKGLLDLSSVDKSKYGAVADLFLKHRDLGDDFWEEAGSSASALGGAEAVKDLRSTVEVGQVMENFAPMMVFLKQKIADPGFHRVSSARDLAKLSQAEWVALINENGKKVPDGTPGDTVDQKVDTYARTRVAQSGRLFRATAFVAEARRSPKLPLVRLQEVEKLLDDHPGLDLAKGNLDLYLKKSGVSLDAATLAEARVVQRVHRLAPDAASGRVLLEGKIHNSAQILAMGRKRFMDLMSEGKVDKRATNTIFGIAQHQYAQALQKLASYRFDLNRAGTKAIIDHTFTAEEIAASEAAGLPDLEALFGSLDFCACEHCQSVYGPAAYLADLLRYLDQHPSEAAGKTVKDLLFERRPDLGDIKLSCGNAETPLPYTDLACEVLENAVAVPGSSPDFSLQTTRPAAELRAAPEHVREKAYEELRKKSYPVDSSFDLWQEEARIYLGHLGAARWQLMEAFQSGDGGARSPSVASIAGEYFGMSSQETALVTAAADSTEARQKEIWGLAAVPAEMTVRDFLDMARLDYGQLLDLLSVTWVTRPDDGQAMLFRPDSTCDTKLQKVRKLSVDKLDRVHRFLRLWRRSGWTMRELDLLIRAARIGNGSLGPDCLGRLHAFRKLQARLKLTVQEGLALFGDIDTEARKDPAAPERALPSHYETLFLNRSITNPVDQGFQLPIPAGKLLSEHKAALLGAFALAEHDLSLLLARIGSDTLSVSHLSRLARYSWLARGLRMPVRDLLSLEAVSGAVDIFAGPAELLAFLEQAGWVEKSGFTAEELSYLLRYQPDSPAGLREEAIAQHISSLRKALRESASGETAGTVASQVATDLGLVVDHARLFLQVELGGETLLAHLSDPELIETDESGAFVKEISPGDLPSIFASYRLLHKLALTVSRFRLSTESLEWLLVNAAKPGLLALGGLPVLGSPASPLFPAWLALAKWVWVKAAFPEPEGVSLREVFELAVDEATPLDSLKEAVAQLTQWAPQEVADLVEALQLQHGTVAGAKRLDFADVGNHLRLQECMSWARRLGVGPKALSAWARRDGDLASQKLVSRQVRQAVKAKYDHQVWLETVTPLEDSLRERKRDALISYLVATSLRSGEPPEITYAGKKYPNPRRWQDANDLLRYFLIDVEMCSCQLTSRIKQAISSTQMFVQRCLLGLELPHVDISRAEQEDEASANSWKQWRWMKSYRVWEANRKVFLYPENWIEPELRDDKSPFFQELESELLQSDLTDSAAEEAFLRYIEKVHEVARLDIVGVYHEVDSEGQGHDLLPDLNRLHVVGRTPGHPAIYYYRSFDLNEGRWTAWEKIDLDIQGDQLVPVVYNRRLYLFWLMLAEKPQKVRKMPPARGTPSGQTSTDAPEAPGQVELQLCWSSRREDGWSAKRISKQKIIHPWQRPLSSYGLKPRYKRRENLLWLDVYLSQSPEFNSARFWDPYLSDRRFATAKAPFDEAARPWHSSSFLFDGGVVAVKMKSLKGQYHLLGSDGYVSKSLIQTDSLTYVRDAYGEAGRAIGGISGPYETAPRLPLPTGMHYEGNKLVNNKQALNQGSVNVLEWGHTRTLLDRAKSPFEIVHSQHTLTFDTGRFGSVPFFFQDDARSFFVKPEWQLAWFFDYPLPTYKYRFYPFHHPYTALFLRELKRFGLDGLLNRRLQTSPEAYYPENGFRFSSYTSSGASSPGFPDKTAEKDMVDFEPYGAYSLYNWEIFFHAPLMIACRLSQNQRFEEAMRWFHYIFDPTNSESSQVPQRYWVTRPFFEQNSDAYRRQRIESLLSEVQQHEKEITAWKNNPFQPHLIARGRPVAYQKAVVMKYLGNLIAWGDHLFRRDTIESINEATTLYVLAYELLGRRPEKVPNVEREDKSYNELTAARDLDIFGNQKVDVLMENYVGSPTAVTGAAAGAQPLPQLDVFYFAIPHNDRLIELWNTVEDRLFKIRHCMNIEGVVRQLPLFEPPIDPALLVKAAAAGVDLGSVIAGLGQGVGPYRFRTLAQKALELCGDVRALGDKLLGALEKKDGEAMALLRSTQEIRLQQAVREARRQQVKEASHSLAALERTRATAEQKQEYYASRDFMNAWEGAALTLNGVSALTETSILIGHILAGTLALIPKVTVGGSGFGGSPHATVDPVDGQKISKAAEGTVEASSALARTLDKYASMAATMGSYQRRSDDWEFQASQAKAEIKQVEKQILAAEVRLALTEKELENQELQIENLQTMDEFMRGKYTNEQLFDWHVRQVAMVYFQSYQLAHDLARRAERCFQHEIGDPLAAFVQPGHWESLKKGLLAGERLTSDIRRMEAAYLERNTRDLEITKHVSLAQIFPLSVIALKQAGSCTVRLPEWLFDMDYPGHYFRRIKSVSVSIPCVVGPYTSLNCTLSLTNNGVRRNESLGAGYGDPLNPGGDTRFLTSVAPVTRIATSHAQNDSGTFELSFNDERFLPFEGAGAVSEWSIRLPRESNQLDLSSVSDVILHVRYTARASESNALIEAAKGNVRASLPAAGARLLELHSELGSEWHRFLHPASVGGEQELAFTLRQEHLPFYARGSAPMALTRVDLILDSAEALGLTVEMTPPGGPAVTQSTVKSEAYGGLHLFSKSEFSPAAPLLGDWKWRIKLGAAADFRSLKPESLRKAYLVLGLKKT